MKISEKRLQAVYNAIHDEIMRVRISYQRDDHIDFQLAQSVDKIFDRVKRELNVQS
jgi:hypothetical protein